MTFLRSSLACLVGLSLLASGCQNYQWGTTPEGQRDAETFVYVAPVVNESDLPLAAPTLTLRLEERLINRPSRHLADEADWADYALEVHLVRGRPEARASLPEDTGRDLTFELEVTADVIWRDPETHIIVNRTQVDASSLIVSRQNLPDATYQVLPDALDELARAILDTAPLAWPEQ
ncbi:MAG: hypothetical protein E1N59_3382 [Puniceicoccaceae bacterium 5H]|nr:MAG: hypothetical protein E1N59_3382 [Puniceicoccaceae bacterium 5H]